MATNKIGPGTCNLSVNVRQETRCGLGRAACGLDLSMGEFTRRLLAFGAPFARVLRAALASKRDDERAAQILSRVLRDGRVTQAEIPSLQEAQALVQRSAQRDEQIANAGLVREGVA